MATVPAAYLCRSGGRFGNAGALLGRKIDPLDQFQEDACAGLVWQVGNHFRETVQRACLGEIERVTLDDRQCSRLSEGFGETVGQHRVFFDGGDAGATLQQAFRQCAQARPYFKNRFAADDPGSVHDAVQRDAVD